MWRFKAEALSGAVVEAVSGKGDVFLGDAVELHLLREELPDEAVHVLVGATFPGGVGMREVEVGPEFAGDALMLCELLAVIGRQRVNGGRKRRQQGNHFRRTGNRVGLGGEKTLSGRS